MKIGGWFNSRGQEFVRKRATALVRRYGLTSAKAKDRIEDCVATLALYGCAPTFPTPGSVVKRYSQFIHGLQDSGAEIAVHSYDHVDLKAFPPAEACGQLMRAVRIFELHGIKAHGFRCPYLSCTDELVDELPNGLFGYSSNTAIRWDVNSFTDNNKSRTVFDTINRFYQPEDARNLACVPWMRINMIEIPVCVPDDLQLYDGLGLDPEGIADVWSQILRQTYKRGNCLHLFSTLSWPDIANNHSRRF